MSATTASLTGAGTLLRVALRHEGPLLAPWVLAVTLLSASSVVAYPWVFPDAAARHALAVAVEANPALGLVFGRADDLTTADGFNAWQTLPLGGFFVALGAVLAVTRVTRGQEDSGQAELLASGVMGRPARLLTGVAVALLGSCAAGVVAGVVTALCGGTWGTSLLIGATYAGTGWMLAAVAAVAAQVGSDARTANALAVGTLGTLFLARGVCVALDAPAWTLWVNPLGWMLETLPAAGNHWAPLLLAVALTVAVVALGFVLQSGRDYGQGFVAPRAGPARGRVRGPLLLAVRLDRGPVLTWAIAFHLLGLVLGYLTTSVPDLVAADAGVRLVLASGAATPEQLTAAFVRTLLNLVGVVAAVPGVQMLLRVRAEERAGRVGPLLAGALPRTRYYASHVAVALTAVTGYLVGAGFVVALMAARADLPVGFLDVLEQTVATAPAVWVVVAVAVALVGARPVAGGATWGVLVATFLLTLLGPTFGLDERVLGVSPFRHVPRTMSAAPDWSGVGWLTLVAAGLVAVGLLGFRRRDLAR